MRIFRGAGDAVIGIDDAYSIAMFGQVVQDGKRNAYAIATQAMTDRGVYVLGGAVHDAMDGQDDVTGSLQAIATLPGVHNYQNAVAAYAICRLMGVKPMTIMAAMVTYPGLPHRMSAIRVINGVVYVNDSKATNADAAARALACYRNVYWILGGKPKESGLNGLEQFSDRIRHAFVIGQAAEAFSKWLENHGIPFSDCGTIDIAVREAHRHAQNNRGQPGGAGVVLLSPACASFDQFRSFEHRGDVFTALVQALPETGEVAAE
jgi:UDP-N-acetylmuramoylalanine--D-glutamate ligase